MNATPASIGDVLVFHGEPEGGNPYRSHGSANPSLSGNARVSSLRALRDGDDTSRWSYWFAPYCGGATRIASPTEVRWDTAGSLDVKP